MTFKDRPVDWVLQRTKSWLALAVEARLANDPPGSAKSFCIERDQFGLIEWADGRWLVMALDRGLAR